MPSLFRFLFVVALLAALVFGAMLALALLVEPNQREMNERIPSERINQ